MSDTNRPAETADNETQSAKPILVTAAVVLCFGVTWLLSHFHPDSFWTIAFLFSQVMLISIVIWQVCDPFADAAQWVGEALHLPGSVRGATLDAIASSMPELFSGIFFVVVAISAVSSGNPADVINAGAEGYGSTIATCAGSAIYNMILIPAFCALVISFARPQRPTIDVEDEVVARDGIWFIGCEMLLILFLFQEQMQWWMGLVFLGLYTVYILQLFRDAGHYRKKMTALRDYFASEGAHVDETDVILALQDHGHQVSRLLVVHARSRFQSGVELGDEDENDHVETAGLLFDYFEVPLNKLSCVLVLVLSTLGAAAACYFLVEATIETAALLNVPTFFVAVILAAAASSVPDTFLAIGAARRGDDSGAVSNAFGSNIFDICICLSIPLFVNSYLTGWQPVSLLQDGKPIPGLMGLRVLLVVLTVLTLTIMWHNRQLTRVKALGLCGLYLVFLGYAVLGSLGILH